MIKEKTLYREIAEVTEDYFGPVAPRFINRIIENHLHKLPSEISRKDLPELLTWVRITVSMITDDQTVIAELTGRLKKL